MQKASTPFKDTCRILRASNPDAWEEFINEMRLYTAQAMEAVVEASAADIMQYKGWAQACKALTTTFSSLDGPT